jgi:hypothetical protein
METIQFPSRAPERGQKDQGFGRTSRTYTIPATGEVYDSVTSILSVVGKPALVAWSANRERTLVMEAAANLHEDLPAGTPKMSRLAYLATLQLRLGKEKAHQKELAQAAEIGQQAHGYVEWLLRRELGQVIGPEPRVSDKALWASVAAQDWCTRVKLRPLALEQVVWSATHRFAGTLDLLGEVTLPGHAGPVYVVADLKTGKAIYGEALLQMSAYVAALREMEHAPAGVYGAVIRLPKVEADPEPEIRLIAPAELEALFRIFLAVKVLWDWQQTERVAATIAVTPQPAVAPAPAAAADPGWWTP